MCGLPLRESPAKTGSGVRGLLSIGEFSRVCRLSIKSLRRYAGQGLLLPAWVDPDSGYRYYRPVQAIEAERIRLLRELDLPLAEIRRIQQQPEQAPQILDAHRRRLRARIEAQQRALERLQVLQQQPPRAYTVRVQQMVPSEALVTRLRASLPELTRQIGPAFAQIMALVARRGGQPAGPGFVRYLQEGFDPDDVEVELGVPTARRLRGADAVRAARLPGGPAATTLHPGPYAEIGGAYAALLAWVADSEHQISGAPREAYLVGPPDGVAPADYRTEVVWPLAP